MKPTLIHILHKQDGSRIIETQAGKQIAGPFSTDGEARAAIDELKQQPEYAEQVCSGTVAAIAGWMG